MAYKYDVLQGLQIPSKVSNKNKSDCAAYNLQPCQVIPRDAENWNRLETFLIILLSLLNFLLKQII